MVSKTKPNGRTGIRHVEWAAKALGMDLFGFFLIAGKRLESEEREEWTRPDMISVAVESFNRFRANGTQGIMEPEPDYEIPGHVIVLAKRIIAAHRICRLLSKQGWTPGRSGYRVAKTALLR